jgi:hypothetical protein
VDQTDPLRKAHVDRITITEGLTSDNVQQQLEAVPRDAMDGGAGAGSARADPLKDKRR